MIGMGLFLIWGYATWKEGAIGNNPPPVAKGLWGNIDRGDKDTKII